VVRLIRQVLQEERIEDLSTEQNAQKKQKSNLKRYSHSVVISHDCM
jgi:hypothetical protein